MGIELSRIPFQIYRKAPRPVAKLLKAALKTADSLFKTNRFYLGALDNMYQDQELLREYNRHVVETLSCLEPINIAAIVTQQYVFDFLIFYYSIVEAWTFYPYVVHAFTNEQSTVAEIESYKLPNCEVHLIEGGGDWRSNVALKIKLVEYSHLSKGVVSDVDNVFLVETPELHFLLDTNEFVFVGCPDEQWILQPSLWAFKRNDQSLAFAEQWHSESINRAFSEASGLPFAIYKNRNNTKLRIKALVLKRSPASAHHRSPYDIQANCRPFSLESDNLGYKEPNMGRAKVLHLGGLRCDGNESVRSRMAILEERFPECRTIFPYYIKLANQAAQRMGRETLQP